MQLFFNGTDITDQLTDLSPEIQEAYLEYLQMLGESQ